MKKYEYMTIHTSLLYNSYSSMIDVEYLDNKGNEGWKLLSVIGDETVFVKEKEA